MAVRRRESGALCEGQPHLRASERYRVDISVVKILAVFTLFVVIGLWYFVKDREMISGDGTIVKTTTGSSPATPRDREERQGSAVQLPPPGMAQPIPAPVLSPKE